jgi:hypothetical protein
VPLQKERAKALRLNPPSAILKYQRGSVRAKFVQGVFSPNKISGVGTNFGLLVHVFPRPNKQHVRQPSMPLSRIREQNN